MNETTIAWTNYSSNPLKYRNNTTGKDVWACVKTSPGCAHCYAEAATFRWERGDPFLPKNIENVTPYVDEKELNRLKTSPKISGKRVFMCDMTDLFGSWVPDALISKIFAALYGRDDVVFQILTKRTDRMREWVNKTGGLPPHIHLGVSIENQRFALERISDLKDTLCALRFLSLEPLLGPIDFRIDTELGPDTMLSDLGGDGIGWVIVGGESGRGARKCNLLWIADIIQQCYTAKVPVFVKQAGSWPVFPHAIVPEIMVHGKYIGITEPKGCDMSQWPQPVRVREYPKPPRADYWSLPEPRRG